MFGPEKPYNSLGNAVGVYSLTYIKNVVLDATCATYANPRCVGATAPILAVTTAPASGNMPTPTEKITTTPSNIMRFDPSQVSAASRWSAIISTARDGSSYRAIGWAPQMNPGVCLGQPAGTPGQLPGPGSNVIPANVPLASGAREGAAAAAAAALAVAAAVARTAY